MDTEDWRTPRTWPTSLGSLSAVRCPAATCRSAALAWLLVLAACSSLPDGSQPSDHQKLAFLGMGASGCREYRMTSPPHLTFVLVEGELSDGSERRVLMSMFEITEAQFVARGSSHRRISSSSSRLPATNMTFWDALRYCETLGLRLPTGEEWELCAGVSLGRVFPWGNKLRSGGVRLREFPIIADAAGSWVKAPVRSYAPRAVDANLSDVSPHGVIGLGGNVLEWCVDKNAHGHRLVKGGCAGGHPEAFEIKSESFGDPYEAYANVGFRVVAPLDWLSSHL